MPYRLWFYKHPKDHHPWAWNRQSTTRDDLSFASPVSFRKWMCLRWLFAQAAPCCREPHSDTFRWYLFDHTCTITRFDSGTFRHIKCKHNKFGNSAKEWLTPIRAFIIRKVAIRNNKRIALIFFFFFFFFFFVAMCCRKRTPDTFQSHILIMRAYSSFRSRHLFGTFRSRHLVKTKLGPLSDVSAPAGRAGRRRGPGCGERCHCQAAQGRRRSCSRMRIGGSQSQRCGMLPDLDVAAVLAWPRAEPGCLCCEGCRCSCHCARC